MNSPPVCVWMSLFARLAAGRSLRLFVTIVCACARIAAATNVAIVRVGQADRRDERLVTRDETVADGADHQDMRPVQLGWLQIRPVLLEAVENLVEDLFGPFRLDEPCLRDAD